MNPEYRKKLLSLMARIEQEIAEAESVAVESPDDVLLRASEQRRVNGM